MLALLLARQGVAGRGARHAHRRQARHRGGGFCRAGHVAAPHRAPAGRPAKLAYIPTEVLCPGLKTLLDVRRTVGLRNPAHSLVKLMNPCAGQALIVGSYTHPEYADSMAATFALTGAHAMLLRGTEGEPVADARRCPRMEAFRDGERHLLQAAQEGSLTALPDLPKDTSAEVTAAYISAVLAR